MQQTALIVDDDQATLIFLQQVLQPLNMEVVCADDGVQAIELLQQMTPDALFLDLLLPGVTGVDVLEFVARTPRLNHTHVIVISAHNKPHSMDALVRADDYLVKPVRVQVIRDIVQRIASHQMTG
jgi:CheY-like chemotaxis protein